MAVLVLSPSDAFIKHVQTVLPHSDIVVHSKVLVMDDLELSSYELVIVHSRIVGHELAETLERLLQFEVLPIGIAADEPNLNEMLSLSNRGVLGYFNSYMADIHYQQMIRYLLDGMSWYPPSLLKGALDLAWRATIQNSSLESLSSLTQRERGIAGAVAQGLSNKEIANKLTISDRTVKAHLSNIFEKLDLKDRVALAILVNS
jgi:DNA-binding NarL/FixJ family response regulator